MTRDVGANSLAAKTTRPLNGHEIRLLFLADKEEIAAPVRSALEAGSGEVSIKFVAVAPRNLRKDLTNVDVILACISDKKSAYLKLLKDLRTSNALVGFVAIAPPESDKLLALYLEAGADDYVSDRELSRLPLTIRNVSEKVNAARALLRMRETNRASADTFEVEKTGVLLIDVANGIIAGMNDTFNKMWRAASGELNFSFANPGSTKARDSFFNKLSKTYPELKKPSRIGIDLPAGNGSHLNIDATIVRMEGRSGSQVMMLIDDVAEITDNGHIPTVAVLHPSRISNGGMTALKQTADYALFALNPDGCMMMWNEDAERLTGYAKEDVLGREFSVLFSENDRREELPRLLLNTARQNGHDEGEFELVPKDGRNLWVRIVTTLLVSETNEPAGFAVVAKELEGNRRWLQVLAEREKELHGLAEHLEAVHENDRTKIARKLHDEFGQMLTALRLDMTILNRMISKSVDSVKRIPLLEKLSVTSQLIESMIMSTFQLRQMSSHTSAVDPEGKRISGWQKPTWSINDRDIMQERDL